MNDEQSTHQPSELRELVAAVAASYFENSHVGASEIRTVISMIAKSLAAVGRDGQNVDAPATGEAAEPVSRKTPAQARKSISADHLISFEDGKPYKTMKRHLAGRGLTPQQYREKHGLPSDYPMVAPSYSAARSAMAKSLGLGQMRKRAKADKPGRVAGAKRGRKPKAEAAVAKTAPTPTAGKPIKPKDETFT